MLAQMMHVPIQKKNYGKDFHSFALKFLANFSNLIQEQSPEQLK